MISRIAVEVSANRCLSTLMSLPRCLCESHEAEFLVFVIHHEKPLDPVTLIRGQQMDVCGFSGCESKPLIVIVATSSERQCDINVIHNPANGSLLAGKRPSKLAS